MTHAGPLIGGAPPVTIRSDPEGHRPAFIEATILPGRGMLLLQARLRLSSGEILDALASPGLTEAAALLSGGPADFAGDASFSLGGAILAPFANRVRGAPVSSSREVLTEIAGEPVRLPRNWGGSAPGAEQYAMHGLILDTPVPWRQPSPDHVLGQLEAGDFGGRWPGRFSFAFAWRLVEGALTLRVEAVNVGPRAAPVGIGWHPYLAIPSGDRRQARLWLGASSRVVVNNYDEVLPTGAVASIDGGPYDFQVGGGTALGELYLDDCFTDLRPGADGLIAEMRDPAAGLGYRVIASGGPIRALQVYAPPQRPILVIEPQFNLADPYGPQWRGRDTGMATVAPGDSVTYEVRLEPFEMDTPEEDDRAPRMERSTYRPSK